MSRSLPPEIEDALWSARDFLEAFGGRMGLGIARRCDRALAAIKNLQTAEDKPEDICHCGDFSREHDAVTGKCAPCHALGSGVPGFKCTKFRLQGTAPEPHADHSTSPEVKHE
jgi:hypothetical protein